MYYTLYCTVLNYTVLYRVKCKYIKSIRSSVHVNDLQPTHAKVQYSIYYALYTILC